MTDLEALNLLIATGDKVTSARLDYLQQTLGLNKLFLSQEFNQLKQGLRYLRDNSGGDFNPGDYDLSEFLNESEDPFLKESGLKNRILHFPLTATIAGSTLWYSLRAESGTVYNPLVIASGYNNISNIITEPRAPKHRIPYDCKIKDIRWIYSTLTTPLVVRLIYFKHDSGSAASTYDNYIVAEHTFPNSGNANAKDEVFSTIDTEFVAEAGGFLTLVFFNNNISTGNLRSTLFEVVIEQI
jgi:hypothetical protein